KSTAGVQGAQSPAGGLGAKPPRPTASVDRHSSEDFRCRLACEDREMRSASTPSPELRLWVNKASSASGRERCERNATPRIHPPARPCPLAQSLARASVARSTDR